MDKYIWMVCSKLYLAHVISVITRFMTNFKCVYWVTLKRVLKYLNGIILCKCSTCILRIL